MDRALRALCGNIQSALGLSAGIGHPDDLEMDVVLWPWRVCAAHPSQVTPTRRPDGTRPAPPTQRLDLSFLLLAPNNLGNLIRAAQCVFETSSLEVDGARYDLRVQPLSEELQISLLAAAGIRMQPVMSYLVAEIPRSG